MFHQVHLSLFLRNFWQSPLLAFVFRLPAGSMSSSSSDHMLKSELTSPWLYCLGLKIEDFGDYNMLQWTTMKAYALYTKLPKDHNLDISMAKPHLTDLSHFFVLCKSRSLMSFLSARHALWIKSIFAYYGMQLAVWHFPTDSNLHFGSIQKWEISSNIPHNYVYIPCDTMSSWLFPQPSGKDLLGTWSGFDGSLYPKHEGRDLRNTNGTEQIFNNHQFAQIIPNHEIWISKWLKILPNWKIHNITLQKSLGLSQWRGKA